ncbi:LysR family transcriptional regulator [Nonomuraea africana]|uniref:DNA-binding transcriptional LysR family regulator n=1 Tax=Nonomuraea africana TaxID=46171 RepID=A0ABR9KPL7_9ACTN|nr:LysR family transcriptional regulator [Nonomuraea africana]MBE1563963.1 DNA-binding transcriptional LysR family regulator [Nonomuraea africana]
MELRDIEIFLTLADLLHFGRTAERLHVSVARVSQAIKKQERGIGAALFYRDSRNVRLTPAGEQLRRDLAPIYQGLKESMGRARLAAQGKTGVLRIGMIPANAHDLRRYWETFRSRHPQWGLRLRHAPFVDPFAGLRRGDVDMLVTWLPVQEPDIVVGPRMFAERRVLAVSVDHELAGRTSATFEMLGDFPVARGRPIPDYWAESYTPWHTPRGNRIERGPDIENVDDIFTLISAGEIVNTFPVHVSRYWNRPDIAWLPIGDMAALDYGLAWRGEAENDMIRAFAQVVRDLGPL